MKTIKAVVKDGQIAVSEPIDWPEGTELRVGLIGDTDWEGPDELGITIRHLSVILRELIDLRNGPERDDYGMLRPAKFAFDAASQLLVDAAMVAATEGRQIPLGCVSTDSQGGVRVEWVRDDSSVHLAVPATNAKSAYIYHEAGNRYATEDATSERLAHWLREIN